MTHWLGAAAASAPDGEDPFVRSALAGRDLIAEAKILIMDRHHLAADEAFELLRHYSRTMDRPLRDVAQKLVHGSWVADA